MFSRRREYKTLNLENIEKEKYNLQINKNDII